MLEYRHILSSISGRVRGFSCCKPLHFATGKLACCDALLSCHSRNMQKVATSVLGTVVKCAQRTGAGAHAGSALLVCGMRQTSLLYLPSTLQLDSQRPRLPARAFADVKRASGAGLMPQAVRRQRPAARSEADTQGSRACLCCRRTRDGFAAGGHDVATDAMRKRVVVAFWLQALRAVPALRERLEQNH